MQVDARMTADWAVHQLSRFLAAVSAAACPRTVLQAAVEQAAEALDAEVCAAVSADGSIDAVVGQPVDSALRAATTRVTATGGRPVPLELPALGACVSVATVLDGDEGGWLVVFRSGQDPLTDEERVLLRGMARMLVHCLGLVRLVQAERLLRENSDRQARDNAELARLLTARQDLLQAGSRIQSLIAERAPLQQVLDSITSGAAALTDADVVALRLVDAGTPDQLVVVSHHGRPGDEPLLGQRSSVLDGPGLAVLSDGLVCFEEHAPAAQALAPHVQGGLAAAMAAAVHEGGRIAGSLTVGTRAEGRVFTEEERAALTAFAEHAGLALTDSRTLEAMNAARHDPLTGLPNRGLFLDRLSQCLAGGGGTVAVLFCDLDHFKRVNDSLGHAAGDALLVGVAERIRASVRPADTVARLGGDEFTVMLEHVADVGDALTAADRVLAALVQPFDVGGGELYVSASVGVALAQPGVDDPGNVLRSADLAMYQAKDSGPGQVRVFHADMSDRALRRMAMETELRRALDLDEFVLHYQPLVSLVTDAVVGVEALARWQHPQRGLVAPGEFIPYAEETGLILPFGQWALSSACEQARRWQDQYGDDAPVVHVNVSPRQFCQPEFVPELAALVARTGLHAHLLTLEITEGLLLADTEATIERCHQIRALGVRLALDDFGTGYSSLSYLRRLPVDEVKIDRSFVNQIDSSPRELALAKSIIDLAHNLGLHTVAEGIERAGQRDHLQRLACDWGQGYLMSRPLPARDLEPLLDGRRAAPRPQLRSRAEPGGSPG